MMGIGITQALWYVIKVGAFACFLLIQESAGETTPGLIPNIDVFISLSPTPEPQPTNDTDLQPPPSIIPPLASTPPHYPLVSPPSPPSDDYAPSLPPISQPEIPPSPTVEPSPNIAPPLSSTPPFPSNSPPSPGNDSVPLLPPVSQPEIPPSPSLQPPPEPLTPPSISVPPPNNQPSVPKSTPPNSHDSPPSAEPVLSPPSPRRMPASPPDSPENPSLSPPLSRISPSAQPISAEPPSPVPPESSENPALSPPLPVVSPSRKRVSAEPPSPIPPDSSKDPGLSPPLPQISPSTKPISAKPPSSEKRPSPMSAPPPSITASSPVSAPAHKATHNVSPLRQTPTQAPSSSNNHPVNAPPPTRPRFRPKKSTRDSQSPSPPPLDVLPPSGSSSHEPPTNSPVSSCDDNCSDAPAPKSRPTPFFSPKKFPSAPPWRSPKPPAPPLQALPPPPPQKDCGPLTCDEPLTYGPPESHCMCVYPIQVGLRLGVALYTFFPSVSELASEIADGVYMNSSHVRIMGANAAGDSPDKTNVAVYLLPVGNGFDYNAAYFVFERFWDKRVVINHSLFGDYDVLYVKYPGLPPSPPLPPSLIANEPYSGSDSHGRTVQQPLGIDVSRNRQHKHNRLNRSILAVIILSALLSIILLSALAWAFVSRYRRSNERMDASPQSTLRSLAKTPASSAVVNGADSRPVSMSSSLASYKGSARTFSVEDLHRATDGFDESRILGEGGFGCVYSGTLDDGTKVAMKVLKRNDQQGAREFLAEVEMLSRLHHRNLVKLIGICVEGHTRCLVYELIPNGSLEAHLHGVDGESSPLDWRARLKIALGAARALAYLHEDSSPPVIHRDFKTSNILLEDDFTPKVSDFGLARNALDERDKHISTHVMGTFGYVAPEYAMTGHLLVKSDVYSYGVVLLELLTGKKPVDMSQPPGLENLVSWARPMLTNRECLRSIVDRSLGGPEIPFDSIAKVAAIASMCVQSEVSHRPFMGEVVQALRLVYEQANSDRSSFSSRNLNGENLRTGDFLEAERDLSVSELLSSSARFGMMTEDYCYYGSSSLWRNLSSSGNMTRTAGKARDWWRNARRMARGSSSEGGGVVLKLWPGSH